jgi:outer membrane protein assembly factor BamD (BamD/ComL family)
MLGGIAQDHGKDHDGATRWFETYLSEQPGGRFAAEAAGRLVEAEDKRGNRAGAERAAKRYLDVYPNGSHAQYARSLLAGGSGRPP